VKTTEARKLLGVGPDATPQAIKKAFRHLAMLWHPDRNPAPNAGEVFGRLNAACNRLLESFPPEDTGEDSSDGDGHKAPGKTANRGADRRQDFELDLEQLYHGDKAEAILESRAECIVCGGQGYTEVDHSQLCPRCQGSGRVRSGKTLAHCEDCDGRGYTHRIRCPQCDGKGEQVNRRTLVVTVPPGMLPGDELRIGGEGFPATSPKGHPGDLFLRIRLHPHSLFDLDGCNLVLDRPTSIFTLLGGGTIAVPSPGGVHHLKIEPGSGSAREELIPGAGLPARGKRAAGDLLVRLQPCLPSAASPALIPLYRALQAEIERSKKESLPELAAWEARWLSKS
jgi:molecular chaperone DnaJ